VSNFNKSKQKNRKKSTGKFFTLTIATIIVALVGAFGLTFGGGAYEYQIKSFGDRIGKGLDLVGGVSILMQTDSDVDEDTLNRTISLLDLRINKMGVSETTIAKEGDNRIRIEIPGKSNTNEVINTVAKTGNLSFKDPEGNVILTGSDIKDAYPQYNQNSNQPEIGLELNDEGRQKFADATAKLIGKTIAVYMDEEKLIEPTVNVAITDGRATITGSESYEEATTRANIIKSGALPVALSVISSKTVDSTLGASALPNSIQSGLIGVALVMLLMIFLYRKSGVASSIALLLYIVLLLLAFLLGRVTLSLPGIAALLLTIGMALDANVLMFERIKDKIREGMSVKNAIEIGYKSSLSSILDSQITTIIAAVILYFLGSGAVKGFAYTLILGIVISLFTALTVTLRLLRWLNDMGWITKPSHVGVKGEQ